MSSIDKNKNNWGINLCETCNNAIRWNIETNMDSYSFKRKGQGYVCVSRCAKSGCYIGLSKVVKCSHYDPIITSITKITVIKK